MITSKRATAVGGLIIAILDVSTKRGGKQKAQKIVGKKIFYESDYAGKWMVGNAAILKLPTPKIEALTEKLKKA
jgi:ribosomal protein L35AE/L33A